MRIARKPDGKADDLLDPPKVAYEQLATDDVILAKGHEHAGTGIGGVKTHHVISRTTWAPRGHQRIKGRAPQSKRF